jgi:hypothetical protein
VADVEDHSVWSTQSGFTQDFLEALVGVQERPRQLRCFASGVAPRLRHLGDAFRRPRKEALATVISTRELTGAVVAPDIGRADLVRDGLHEQALCVEGVDGRSME